MLEIDHYNGAYGPNIWLEADSAPELTQLHAIFLRLAQGAGDEIELCSAMAARAVNLRELRLRLDPSPRARRLRLVRRPNYDRTRDQAPQPHSFDWSDTRAGWKRQADLVESLLRKSGAGCRDLSVEGVDDALIELSFRRAG